LDASNFEFISISDIHFSSQAVLIFNAEIEDVIVLSDTKKLIWNDRQGTITLLLHMLGEDKGSLDDELLVTLFISPKSYTNISITLTVSS
jgi:hypothetical protein